jgi:putative transposase
MAAVGWYPGAVDDEERQKVALWRMGVLGPLVSARLEHGDRRAYFEAAAERWHEPPDGEPTKLSARTIESWYYAFRKGGFHALFPEVRADRGKSRAIRPEIAELIVRAKREKPRRSIRRIIRMMVRAGIVQPKELSRSTVHRLLAVAGISQRPLRGPAAERRSFIVEHAGDLWVGDALHGPRVITPDKQLRKTYLLSQIDCATRYIPHSYFALSEDAAAQEHGFRQAIEIAGPPGVYYVDHGAAYIATSLRLICAELDVHLVHAGVKDAEAKGVIERWHRTWREEVGDEIGERVLTLDELNAIHAAWLSEDYHAHKHETTGRAPREHWLGELSFLRTLPRHKKLDEIFLHRERRTVRKDGTVRFQGRLLEVRAELTDQKIELRFDPSDSAALPRVFQGDRFVCDTVVLDRLRNATRKRQRPLGEPEPFAEPSGLDPLALLVRDHQQRTRPFGAPDQAESERAFRLALESDEDTED